VEYAVTHAGTPSSKGIIPNRFAIQEIKAAPSRS